MWHVKTEGLREEGRLRLAGIVQEQHPDRARLFMQWQRMDWPVLVDSLNLLGVRSVPITLLIDERGIIRAVQPREDDLARFLETDYSAGSDEAGTADRVERAESPVRPGPTEAGPAETGSAESWRAYADELFLWKKPFPGDRVIAAYQTALGKEPGHDATHFRLGVALRKRHDSNQRQPGDFQKAVDSWKTALEMNPNQYIWRRRIEQFGPRLDKPYPFYDWVETARQEIIERGERPVPLRAEPSGAEIATPIRDLKGAAERPEPDPRGRIQRDGEGFIQVETVVVPPRIEPGQAVRIHLLFEPNAALKAHWNNEVDDLTVWVNAPEGWTLEERSVSTPNPPQAVSLETRRVEFEVRAPKGIPAGEVHFPAYALYYVCEDTDGQCLFRRQDLRIEVRIVPGE